MGKAILFTSGKGGVGKSTLASAVAVNLARRGRRTVLVDADIGLRCADLMLGVENKVIYDMGDLLSGTVPLGTALVSCGALPMLKLLAAPQMMSAGDIGKKEMRRLIGVLRERFDFVLMDCPAGIGRGMKNVLGCADETVIVCTMDDICLRDAERVLSLFDVENEAHPWLLFNKAELKLIRDARVGMPQDLAVALDMPLLGVVPYSAEVAHAVIDRKNPADCNKDGAADAIARVCSRLCGEAVPLPVFKLSLRGKHRIKAGSGL